MPILSVGGVPLEFDHQRIDSIFLGSRDRHQPFSVFLVDVNVLACSVYDKKYRSLLLNSGLNSCDGSFLAVIASFFYGKALRAYNGPDLFRMHIANSSCKQLIVGTTSVAYQTLVRMLGDFGHSSNHLNHLPLPFLDVNDFDYPSIASSINSLSPDIIWVSLGAPKQEVFITKLLPYVDHGVLVASGAALDFYIQRIHHTRRQIGTLRLIWLSRLLSNPLKQSRRLLKFFLVFPFILFTTAFRR